MAMELAPGADDVSYADQPSWSALLAFGLATRVIVVVMGCLIARPENPVTSGAAFWTHNDGMNPRHRQALTRGHRPWIQSWYRWDAMWYAEIAERGYSYRPGRQSSVAFMPMLPLLMRAGEYLRLDRYWAGVLVPNLAFVAGLAFFGRCVIRVTNDAATSWRACILLAAFPTSFFFSAPYHESLVLALSAASLLAWLNYRPGRSALALAVASATRLTALSMSVGLVLEWAADLGRRRRARHSAWFVAIAGTAGLALFFGYLAWQFHDPMLHLKAHAAWGRKPPSVSSLCYWVYNSPTLGQKSAIFALTFIPLGAWLCHAPLYAAATRLAGTAILGRTASLAPQVPTLRTVQLAGPLIAAFAVLLCAIGLLVLRAMGLSVSVRPALRAVTEGRDALAALLFLGLGTHAFLKRRALWGCLVLVPILQALASGSTMSMTRVVLSAYPAFLDAAELTSGRASFALAIACCLIGQLAMLSSYVNWTFIG
ncbi:MAG: mannosyltransferase family protein [Isosphaeraceae bacterium]